ncbi:glycosyltransferase family 39 protein [Patescibacteria group bacterium]|nr:glycosyltransferase family 39 protein [Patescibacteria group bacterium]
MQNDDWNRNTTVARFMSGDFSLLQVTSTTFYAQGLLGMIFSFIFGWKNLPFLTFFISLFNFYVFAKILNDHFDLNKPMSCLVSLIMFFTPLHIYSSIGFMTENYTMVFMLLAIYFLLEYEKTHKIKSFLFFNISGIISFFTKQNGIIINFAYIPYLLLKKRFKEAITQTLVVGTLFAYYFQYFPRTSGMYSKGFIFENFSETKYAYSLFYGILLVTTSFVLPFVFNFVITTLVRNRKKVFNILFIIISAGLLYFLLNKFYVPGKISWEEYPYFENTFERTGFFPRSIMGTKYHFKWNFDLFRFWDFASKIMLALLIPCLFFIKRKIFNIFSVSIVGYIVLMIFTSIFFDRYLLPLIPLFILFLIHITVFDTKLKYVYLSTLVIFSVFSAFLSTQMAKDFVISNSYVWDRSESLVNEGTSANKIRATMAWQKLYGLSDEPEFFFSFSSPETEPAYLEQYDIFEDKDLNFQGSIFVEPRIYLYKKR